MPQLIDLRRPPSLLFVVLGVCGEEVIRCAKGGRAGPSPFLARLAVAYRAQRSDAGSCCGVLRDCCSVCRSSASFCAEKWFDFSNWDDDAGDELLARFFPLCVERNELAGSELRGPCCQKT